MCDCARGARVCVRALEGDAAECARLRALGLVEGAEVDVLETGIVWVLRVRGARLALARAVAERIGVSVG